MMKDKDHLRMNKIAAGILVAGLLVFGIGYIGDALYQVDRVPEVAGYAVDGSAAVETSAGGAAAAVLEPIVPLLAAASVENGLKVFKKCQTCHTHEKDGAHRVGPNLYDIVGLAIAAKEGYAYSKALKGLEGEWDYEALNGFLVSPRKYVKGTKMGFAGLKKPSERADIILYLRSLSDQPKALPKNP